MNKTRILIGSCASLFYLTHAYATDLVEVYQQALHSDPTFQQAIAVHLASQEGIAIARAPLLPQVGFTGTGNYSSLQASGSGVANKGNTKTRGYNLNLSLTQQLLNFEDTDTLAQSKITAAAADAEFEFSKQDLMMRVATAYFNVLKSEEEVRYALAKKNVFKRQLQQTQQQYHVGLKTMTDVDLAQSSYDNAVADYIVTTNNLQDAGENLRAITNIQYDNMNQLQDNFPLIAPNPADAKQWADAAIKQNWQLQSDRLTAQAAQKNINIQKDAGYPTLDAEAQYGDINSHVWDATPSATTHTTGPVLSLNLNYPLFQGGLITSSTRQAVDQYESAAQASELSYRTTINNTRQDYLKIIASISTIKADRQAIKHGESALEGVFAGYKVGTKTMVDILTAQEQLFQAQSQYAQDRFTYITTSLQLKEDTGTLSLKDLDAVNGWLVSPSVAADEYKSSVLGSSTKTSTKKLSAPRTKTS